MTYYLNIIDTTRESIPHIDYYVHLQNLSTFKIDTKQTKNIINTHCEPLVVEAISVKTYFKSLKISSMFSTRNKREDSERVNVVYLFTCSEGRWGIWPTPFLLVANSTDIEGVVLEHCVNYE